MSKFSELKEQSKIILKDSTKVSLTLFKIMIPTLIVVKILTYYGLTTYLGVQIKPLMTFIGLPPDAGLVWMATMFTNIYTGLAVFLTVQSNATWSEAQVTVLGTIMLICHNLPIEVRVAQKAGCRFLIIFTLRLLGAITLGFILNLIYTSFNLLQKPALVQIPENKASWLTEKLTSLVQVVLRNEPISKWVTEQSILCVEIFFVIMLLIAGIKILREIGVEKIISKILQPVLRILGINPSATSITIVGMTLGLAYGGGLLIQEAESGKVSKADVFASVCLLSLCHSQIEDTLLIMLLGAHLSGIFWARLAFALIVVYLIVQLQRRVSPATSEKFFVTDVVKA